MTDYDGHSCPECGAPEGALVITSAGSDGCRWGAGFECVACLCRFSVAGQCGTPATIDKVEIHATR